MVSFGSGPQDSGCLLIMLVIAGLVRNANNRRTRMQSSNSGQSDRLRRHSIPSTSLLLAQPTAKEETSLHRTGARALRYVTLRLLPRLFHHMSTAGS